MEHNTRRRLDLAGKWDLAFDAASNGLRAGWVSGNWSSSSETVGVPALWTVTHPEVTGVGFYRKAFTVPAAWAGQVVYVHIGGASYRLDAWLNGSYIGSHEGAYTPFSFDITRAMRAGAQNELVLRVASLSKTEAIDGLILQQCPASKQSWYYIEAGLWGDVYLEARPLLWCDAISIEPDLQNKRVLVEVETRNGQPEPRQGTLHLVVTDPNGRIAAELTPAVALLPGATRRAYRLQLGRPLPWSCENPGLYRVEATLIVDGAPSDSLGATFGMRDFTVSDGQFLLNGQPIYLRGVLLQPNYPLTLITPPESGMMRREISLAKEAGLNLIRTHIRPSPPGFLDLCDEMGMLVYAEACMAWIKDSPRLLEHGQREMEAMIRRDKNHPSVVFWGVYNENRQAAALTADELTRFTRALDPTRVIVDDSGGSLAIDQDFGWVDRATVIPSGQTERQKIIDIHIYVGAPTPDLAYEWLRTLGAGTSTVDLSSLGIGLPPVYEEFFRELRSYQGKIFVSELGCGGMSDLRDTVARFEGREGVDARELRLFRDSMESGFKARRLDSVFGSLDSLFAAAQEQQASGDVRQIEAVLANPRSSGYCLTQLNDVAWEFHAGILDLWRQPKRVYDALKRVNRPHVLIVKAAHSMSACSTTVPVAVTVASTLPAASPGSVQITVRDDSGMERLHESFAVPAGAGIKELGAIMVDTGARSGLLSVAGRLYDSEGVLVAETIETITVLPPCDAGPALQHVRWMGAPPAGCAVAPRAADRALLGAAQPGSLSSEDWQELLSAVESGSAAIIGPLTPGDHAAIAALSGRGLRVRVEMGIGSWMGCYHWIPASPLLAGLPAGGLAGEAYTSVLPRHVLTEQAGDVLAGSLRNTNSRFESPSMLWFSDVEAVTYGKGKLVFCQYRVFSDAGNPLAARLLCNLIDVSKKL